MNRHMHLRNASVAIAMLAIACTSAVAQSNSHKKQTMSPQERLDYNRQKNAELNERNRQVGRYSPYFSREAAMEDFEQKHRPAPAPVPNPGPFPPPHGPGQHCHSRYCCWIEGHYESYERVIWVPAHWEERYVPPVYGYRWVNGIQRVVMYQQGYYDRVWVPGYNTTQLESVWVPGHWSCGF
ncbi:MAG: hypothetical protein K1Y02_18895 [Candidatus Hydrogenedentes bacterium]|nr:hypothetical protein [Candidatus Hydrogenedentota bacterium]